MSPPGLEAGAALRRLARLHGVQGSYRDGRGRRRRASEVSLVRVLQALGEPLASRGDAVAALSRAQAREWDGRLDPVGVAWDGRGGRCLLRLPAADAAGRWSGTLELEGGRTVPLGWDLGRAPRVGSTIAAGQRCVAVALPLPEPLPPGYHTVRVPRAGERGKALVISAPMRAYEPPRGERRWGVFVPLHALSSSHSWGVGDYTDLAAFAEWVGAQGGSLVGTLPLLSTFLGRVYEPSPYSPVTRSFWNEAFLDLSRDRAAGEPSVRTDLGPLRAERLVDYARVAALKRDGLRSLASGRGSLAASEDPELDAYASFRAATDARGEWPTWPGAAPGRAPRLPSVPPEDAAVYAVAQTLAAAQLAEAARRAAARGVDLYLDLPIGAHPSGFDLWRHPDAFVPGVSVGAPPDTVFTSGQDWGFPPPHPDRIRERGYRDFAAVLRRQMRIAKVLRLDHVMALHRLFWIPHGLRGTDGVYVHYRADEFYAVLVLESTRNRCVVVGENLGTVPAYVNRSLRRHGIRPLYVAQYAMEGPGPDLPPKVPPGAVASVNTHDMPPFASYWAGRDIAERAAASLIPTDEVASEQRRRARIRDRVVRTLAREGWLHGRPTRRAVFDALVGFLAASDAWAVLVNLEDLWGETEPQNLPGTGLERPNWRKRLRFSLEEIREDRTVARALARVDSLRKGRTG